MKPETRPLVLLVLFAGGLISVGQLLNVLWSREQIKKHLRGRFCNPLSIRWIPYPFGYWAAFYPACIAFRVTFIDASNCIQTMRCCVHNWFHSVHWVSDDLAYLDRNLPRLFRGLSLAIAVFLLWFGYKHLATGTFALPALQPVWVWHGLSVTLLSAASICGGGNLLTNAFFRSMATAKERRWMLFARAIAFIGWLLFGAAFAVAAWGDLR